MIASTSSSTWKPCWHPPVLWVGPPALTAHGRTAPTVPALPTESFPAGDFEIGHRLTRGPWTTNGPAHRVLVPAFALDSTPVTNAAYAQFIAEGGYTDHAGGPDGDARAGRRVVAPAVLGAQRPRLVVLPVRRDASGAPGRAGCTRLLVRGGRLCALGRAPVRPRRSGRRRPATNPVTGRSRRYPVGRWDPMSNAAPGRAPISARPPSVLSEALGVRGPPVDRPTCGSGRRVTRATPALSPFPYKEYSRSFSAPDTSAARWRLGGRPRWPAGARSATGHPSAADLRGFRTARDARPEEVGTDVPSICLPGAGVPAANWSSLPRTAAGTVL